jgi:AcrR family transcriptional regulator
MCSTMLYVGTGFFTGHATDRVAQTLSTIFLSGLALDAPADEVLDGSASMRGVTDVIHTWQDPEEPQDGDKAALIRAAARAEFGRRGYEVTTVRQIAARARVSTGAVYRAIGSKEELLASIATDFSQKVMLGWSATLTAPSSAVEKVDGLFWLHINVMERYYDEFKMQLAWLRQSPPETSMFHWSFQAAVRGLQTMLADGVKSGDLRALNVSRDLIARCILALTWMPEDSARSLDRRAALSLARETVLRGALRS